VTEIEFLVELLSKEEMSDGLKTKLLARIGEVERNRNFLPAPYVVPYVTTPHIILNPPLIPCQHEYPFPWFGTVPPSCKKCGQGQQYPYYTITCTNTDLGKVETGLLSQVSSTSLKLS
jgi:hypothetical protein